MRYLQPSFTVESPGKVFGCEACIYGETHGYPHTFGEGCAFENQARAPQMRCRDITCRRMTQDFATGLCRKHREHHAAVAKASKSLVGLTIPDRLHG